MTPQPANPLHASAVALSGGGVLLMGESASGKSSLAAQLIDAHGGRLIADDRVQLSAQDGQLIASAPDALRGLLEVRGLGVVAMAYIEAAPLVLAVSLVPRQEVPRVADAAYFEAHNLRLPLLHVHGFDAACAITIKTALAHLPEKGFQADGLYSAEASKTA